MVALRIILCTNSQLQCCRRSPVPTGYIVDMQHAIWGPILQRFSVYVNTNLLSQILNQINKLTYICAYIKLGN